MLGRAVYMRMESGVITWNVRWGFVGIKITFVAKWNTIHSVSKQSNESVDRKRKQNRTENHKAGAGGCAAYGKMERLSSDRLIRKTCRFVCATLMPPTGPRSSSVVHTNLFLCLNWKIYLFTRCTVHDGHCEFICEQLSCVRRRHEVWCLSVSHTFFYCLRVHIFPHFKCPVLFLCSSSHRDVVCYCFAMPICVALTKANKDCVPVDANKSDSNKKIYKKWNCRDRGTKRVFRFRQRFSVCNVHRMVGNVNALIVTSAPKPLDKCNQIEAGWFVQSVVSFHVDSLIIKSKASAIGVRASQSMAFARQTEKRWIHIFSH